MDGYITILLFKEQRMNTHSWLKKKYIKDCSSVSIIFSTNKNFDITPASMLFVFAGKDHNVWLTIAIKVMVYIAVMHIFSPTEGSAIPAAMES